MKRPCNALTLLLSTMAATLLILGSMASPSHAYWCPLAEELRVAGLDAACEHVRHTSGQDLRDPEDVCPQESSAEAKLASTPQDNSSDLGAYRYNYETGSYEYEDEYRFEEAYGYDDYTYEDDYGYGYSDETADVTSDETAEYPYEDEYAYGYEDGEFQYQQSASADEQNDASDSYAEMYDYDFGRRTADDFDAEPAAPAPVVTAAKEIADAPTEAYGYEYGYDEYGVPYDDYEEDYGDFNSDYNYAGDDAEYGYEAEQAREYAAEQIEAESVLDPAADMQPAERPEQPELPEFVQDSPATHPRSYDYYRQPHEGFEDDLHEFGAVYGVNENDELIVQTEQAEPMEDDMFMTGYDAEYDMAVYQSKQEREELADARINYDWADADLLTEVVQPVDAEAKPATENLVSLPATLGDTSDICPSVECPATLSAGDDCLVPSPSAVIDEIRPRTAVRPSDRDLLRGCRVDDLIVDQQVVRNDDPAPCPPVPPALPCELSDEDLADELARCNDPRRGEALHATVGPVVPEGYFSHTRLIRESFAAMDQFDQALGQSYLRLMELAGDRFEALARRPVSNERR